MINVFLNVKCLPSVFRRAGVVTAPLRKVKSQRLCSLHVNRGIYSVTLEISGPVGTSLSTGRPFREGANISLMHPVFMPSHIADIGWAKRSQIARTGGLRLTDLFLFVLRQGVQWSCRCQFSMKFQEVPGSEEHSQKNPRPVREMGYSKVNIVLGSPLDRGRSENWGICTERMKEIMWHP